MGLRAIRVYPRPDHLWVIMIGNNKPWASFRWAPSEAVAQEVRKDLPSR
jgi:hypothetical protein